MIERDLLLLTPIPLHLSTALLSRSSLLYHATSLWVRVCLCVCVGVGLCLCVCICVRGRCVVRDASLGFVRSCGSVWNKLPRLSLSLSSPAAQNLPLHTHRTSVQMAHGRRQGVGAPLSDPLLSSCASRHSHPKEVLSAWTATKAFRPRHSPVRRPVLKTVRARNTAHVCTHRANTVCTRLFGKRRNLLACCCRGLKALRA